mgnify:CR=1 FL=1|jgi:UDP-4-amino-4-deoxy-L-arabinose formyltransferase/UDP-glucuronic acid dehydrogenase (UDP-4-keto-hexauronic acid decarboxylating)
MGDKQMEKCILCGCLYAGSEIVKKIYQKGYFGDIIIFTYNKEGNGQLIEFAKERGIKCFFDNINNHHRFVEQFAPDYLFSIYYRDIISKDILDNVKKKSINLHPSLLPKHKGCFSAPWAILDGDEYAGITYHEMREKVDAGNILLQRKIKIENIDTGFSLYNKLVKIGIDSFDEMFQKIVIEKEDGIEQKEVGSFHYRKVPFEGKIDLNWNLEFIDRFIRALYFPPYTGAVLDYLGKNYEFQDINSFIRFCKANKISLKGEEYS